METRTGYSLAYCRSLWPSVSETSCFKSISLGTSDEVWGLGFSAWTKALNVILLVSFVMILMNLEQTFRSAVGTMRWRIKFVVVALGVIFGARLYTRIQAILFAAPAIGLWTVESAALLIGCAFPGGGLRANATGRDRRVSLVGGRFGLP